MLAKIFKKSGRRSAASQSALHRLAKFDARYAECTVVRSADGKKIQDEVGPVSFYRRENRLFTRGQSLYLAPPEGFRPDEVPFSGRGEVLNLRFYHGSIPYSLDCQVVQRVRFSERLLGGLEPRAPVGYKLTPVNDVERNENRRALRFSNARGAKGTRVLPYFRFDLFVELVRQGGLPHETPPEVVPYPGDDPVPDEVKACESPEELVRFFHCMLLANPPHLQQVHLTKILSNSKTGTTEFLDLGYRPVLGLKGEKKGSQIHVRSPVASSRKEKIAPESLRDGDLVVVRFVGRCLIDGMDTHYSWVCRVFKRGLEVVVIRPRGKITRQTGLAVALRDFSLSGVRIQNNPLLETYLVGEDEIPDDPEAVLERLEETRILLHFHPRMHFPNELGIYRPHVPAAFSILGEIVRGRVETRKDKDTISDLGIAFRYDPADYDGDQFEVTAWEPLRNLRENVEFKEINRALNGLVACLEMNKARPK